MRRRRLLFPPQATLLGLSLTLVGFLAPLIVFSWLTLGVLAFANHDGWQTIVGISRQSWVFPVMPGNFTQAEKSIAAVAFFVSLVPTIMCVNWTTRLWRRLVVEKYKWMTNEQVDDFLKRDPGW